MIPRLCFLIIEAWPLSGRGLEQNVPPAHLVLQILRHSLLNVPLLTTEIFLPHVLLSENSNTENKFVHDAANEQQSN